MLIQAYHFGTILIDFFIYFFAKSGYKVQRVIAIRKNSSNVIIVGQVI